MVTLTEDGKIVMRIVLLIIFVMLTLHNLITDDVKDLSITVRYPRVNRVDLLPVNMTHSDLKLLLLDRCLLDLLIENLLVEEPDCVGTGHKKNNSCRGSDHDDRRVVGLESLGSTDGDVPVSCLVLPDDVHSGDEYLLVAIGST